MKGLQKSMVMGYVLAIISITLLPHTKTLSAIADSVFTIGYVCTSKSESRWALR